MRKPILANSKDRSKLAQRHPYAGEPEEWIESAISFDFFVNWQSGAVQEEIWVKGILDSGEVPPPTDAAAYLERFDRKFADLVRFAGAFHFDVHYIAFEDSQDWTKDEAVLYDIHGAGSGWISRPVALKEIKGRICELSGGEIQIGQKGLIYSTSRLEACLSHTKYLWPGDADGIIIGKDQRPLALLEYKKHTKAYPYRGARTYYNSGADKRKYNRLQLLKEAIDPSLPFITITYPTREEFHSVLLELIIVDVGRQTMEVAAAAGCPLPVRGEANLVYKQTLYSLMKQWQELQNTRK